MFNWMRFTPNLRLLDEQEDEFGAAFAAGIGEEYGADAGGKEESATNEGSEGEDDKTTTDGEGVDKATGDTTPSSQEQGTEGGTDGATSGESSGEGQGDKAKTGEQSGQEGEGQGEGSGQQHPAAQQPTQTQQQAVEGDGGVPVDNGAGQQTLDPATLAYMFQHLTAGNRAQQQGQAQQGQAQEGQQGQAQGQEKQEPQVPKSWQDYLTDEEKQVLDKYGQEWDEVSKAEQIRTAAMARHTREQVLAEVNQALAPIVEHIQKSQVQSHFSQIRAAHSDFDGLRKTGELTQWAGSISNPMVRAAAQQVLKEGTAEEIIGLLDLYKQEKGVSTTGQSTGAAPDVPASSQVPASNGSTPKVTQQTQAPAKPANPKAAAATAAVETGSRGADPRGNNPDDFMAGFQATAAETD